MLIQLIRLENMLRGRSGRVCCCGGARLPQRSTHSGWLGGLLSWCCGWCCWSRLLLQKQRNDHLTEAYLVKPACLTLIALGLAVTLFALGLALTRQVLDQTNQAFVLCATTINHCTESMFAKPCNLWGYQDCLVGWYP